MGVPSIRFDGSLAGVGITGQDRSAFVVGETVTMTDTNPANAAGPRVWTILERPTGSVNNLDNPALLSPSLILDSVGTWRVKVVFNGIDEKEARFSVRLPKTNVRVPAYGEKGQWNEAGAAKGWHIAMEEEMRQLDDLHYTRTTFWSCGNRSHNSATPLVVGQFNFNPLTFNLNTSKLQFIFRGVAVNGASGISTHLVLYNFTDSEVVANLNFTSDTLTTLFSAATISNGAGAIKLGNRLYEVRMFVDSPTLPTHTINLGGAEVEVRTLI
jgi:hypothetical protein